MDIPDIRAVLPEVLVKLAALLVGDFDARIEAGQSHPGCIKGIALLDGGEHPCHVTVTLCFCSADQETIEAADVLSSNKERKAVVH